VGSFGLASLPASPLLLLAGAAWGGGVAAVPLLGTTTTTTAGGLDSCVGGGLSAGELG